MRRAVAAVFLLVFLLSGCWSRRELTEVSFVGTMGLDWEDGQYVVSLNILAPRSQLGESGGAGEHKGAVWTITQRADALDEAVAAIDQVTSRAITLAHVRSVIIGEALARRGIGPAIDFLLRSVALRPTVWIGVTNGRADELLKARPRQEGAPMDGPLGHHDTAQSRGSVTPARRLTQVAHILQEEGIDLSLPLFRLANRPGPSDELSKSPDHDSPQEVIFGGAGVFRGDRLVEFISPQLARGILWAEGAIFRGAVSAMCPDSKGHVMYRLRKGRGRVSTFLQGRQVRAALQIRVIADVNEIGCADQVLGRTDTNRLADILSEQVRQDVEDVLAVSRATGSDFLGIGQALYRRRPGAYRAAAASWSERLTDLPVTIDVRAQVVRTGQLFYRYQWSDERG